MTTAPRSPKYFSLSFAAILAAASVGGCAGEAASGDESSDIAASPDGLTINTNITLPGATLLGRTIRVPQDAQTIQRAIAIARSIDTIVLAPGTYTESFSITGKSATIRGSGRQLTTIAAVNSQATVATLGPGVTASFGDLSFRGGTDVVASPAIAGTRPGSLRIENVSFAPVGRAIRGSFDELVIKNSTILGGGLDAAIIVNAARRLDLEKVIGKDAKGVGILAYNETYSSGCGLVFNDLWLEGNERGGLVVYGGACPVEINRGTYKDNRIVGIGLLRTKPAKVRDASILTSKPRASDGAFGDGLFVWASLVSVSNVKFDGHARAGLSVFGCQTPGHAGDMSRVWLSGSRFSHNGFDIDAERGPFNSPLPAGGCGPYSVQIEDTGGNTCPLVSGELGSCHISTSSLEPIPAPAIDMK